MSHSRSDVESRRLEAEAIVYRRGDIMVITGFPLRFFNRRETCQLSGQHAAGNGKADLELIRLAQDIPIGRQRILLAPEHDPNVCSVVPGGIEVRVVTCRGKSREPLSVPDGPGQRRDVQRTGVRGTRWRRHACQVPMHPVLHGEGAWAVSTHSQHVCRPKAPHKMHTN